MTQPTSLKRTRYEVLPTTPEERKATGRPWKFTRNSETVGTYDTKRQAVEVATTVARSAWKTQGQLGELKIKRLDGTIQDPRTYGRDPHKTKG